MRIVELLRPQSGLGDARIVMGQVSGALYVRVGDTWHPVLNLASARLVAATDTNPQPVRESELARIKRGPLLGIPGAPQLLSQPLPIERIGLDDLRQRERRGNHGSRRAADRLGGPSAGRRSGHPGGDA